MTRSERIQAFQMRLDGKSWTAIGAALGYTPNGVRLDILNAIKHTPRQITCVYPAIREYIELECGGSVERFAHHCNIPPGTMSNLVTGHHKPNMETTRLILAATGLTFEDAFRQEDT